MAQRSQHKETSLDRKAVFYPISPNLAPYQEFLDVLSTDWSDREYFQTIFELTLESDRWPSWSARNRRLLHSRGCWPVVDGSAIEPTDTSSEEYRLWVEVNRAAHYQITSNLSSSLQRVLRIHYFDSRTAKETWDCLVQWFEGPNPFRLLSPSLRNRPPAGEKPYR